MSTMPDRRLGTGLEALLGGAVPAAEAGAVFLPVEQIRPNPWQPRSEFPPEEIERLAQSIRAAGLLQPVVVRPQNGTYELVCGERRWRAARVAGLLRIPAIVRETPDEQMLLHALVENIQREDLDPIEKARAFRVLLEKSGGSQEELGAALGCDRSTISNYLRLLDLPAEVQEAVASGAIGMGHARAIAGLGSRAEQLELLRRSLRDGLSVRAVEALARIRSASRSRGTRRADPIVADLERRLSDYFATRVQVRGSGSRGRIVIDYYDAEQFRSILSRLGVVS